MKKLDQRMNGEITRKQNKIVPEDMQRIHVPEYKAWILVPKNLTHDEILQRVRKYIIRVESDRTRDLDRQMRRIVQ